MNRVVLCGQLAQRPRISSTASGLPLATLRLQVPRQGVSELSHAIDEIECVAFEELAHQLHRWGEPGLRVNLEGWLLAGWCRDEAGEAFLLARVAIEAAYWLDSREFAAAPVSDKLSPHPSPEITPLDQAPVAPDEPHPPFLTRARTLFTRFVRRFKRAGGRMPTNGKADLGCNWR